MNALPGKLIICVLFFTTAAYCLAGDKKTESCDYYKVLLNAKSFSVGGTSYAGTPTKETIAFKHIFFSKNADEQFKKLLENANLEGKLYALSGLYFYDSCAYKKTVEKFLGIDDAVTVFSGCILNKIKIKELIKRESENVVRLSNNRETIEEWQNKNHAMNGFSVDFYGGGYPQLLKEYIISDDERVQSK
ncbi:MAG: hypothetical protein P8Y63_01125 [Deltaproteobacteria bacterium]|jgi:hypothetical protein